jgi:hypothetical protein
MTSLFTLKQELFWWPYSFLNDYLIILSLLLDHALQKNPQTAENNFLEMLFESHFSINSLSDCNSSKKPIEFT